MVNIRSAEFVKGIRGTDEILTDGVPEIAFVGRSNVGKSSMINSLVKSRDLVKTGKKPGKTTEINLFSINHRECYFVDLPGYGYADMPTKDREKIQKLIYWYLMESGARPKYVVLILDIKAGLTEFDKQTIGFLQQQKHPYIIVANKVDKVNQKEASEQIAMIRKEARDAEVIAYSSKEENARVREALLEKLLGPSSKT